MSRNLNSPRCISRVCVVNEHIKCADDNCTCVCHTDPVLVQHFRNKLREQLHAETERAIASITRDIV